MRPLCRLRGCRSTNLSQLPCQPEARYRPSASVMARAQIQNVAGVLSGALFCVMVAEIGVLADAGPVGFSRRAYLLTTPLFVLLPVATALHGWLSWQSGHGNSSPGARRFQATMLAVVLIGAVLYAVLVGPSWGDVPGATYHVLYAHLGKPLWAVLALLVLTSSGFVFAHHVMGVLRRVFEGRPSLAMLLAASAALLLWMVALNGLAVFITGATLLGG